MAPPSSIAHYRIVSSLGEGGMGTVYRATDTRLNRDVAIKVLPEAFAQDAGRMARFEREAQVLASLNHPNIAAIYGIENGALVMELVDGPDLKGPVPIETAIGYARQIAFALEAAHEKGIVHRDLKPANIKITPDGVVKLLDFGLAKTENQAVAAAASTNPTMSSTLSLTMTQAGMILGTAAYMSPEQARGQTVDKRADIWAFGVVLFELLTGSALFGGGETISDSLAAVIMKEPDWNALPAGTPPRVRRLLEHCLRKDPKQRLRDIGDARLLLEESEPAMAAAAVAPRLKWAPWGLAGVALLAGGAAWLPTKISAPAPALARFVVALPEGVSLTAGPAYTAAVPSPDGRHLALIVRGGHGERPTIWLRTLNSPTIHRLENTENASLPFWSTTGQEIAFFANEKLMAIALSGGSPRRICDIPASLDPQGGSWNADNTIVFGSDQSPLLRVPAAGGSKPTPVTVLAKDEVAHISPQFLPDGRHLLYLARKTDREKSTIYVQELGSTKRVAVKQNPTRAMFSPPGYLLFVRDGTLLAQHMSEANFQVSGEPMALQQEVAANEINGRSNFSVSQNGVLAYRAGTGARTLQLAWHDRQGTRLGPVGNAREFGGLSLSPDGKSLAVVIGSLTSANTWVMDLASGVLTQLTHDGGDLVRGAPAWSADSQRLAIAGQAGGIREIEVASGKAATLTNEKLTPEAWTPDGRTLLCINTNGTRLSRLTLGEGAKAQVILATQHQQVGYRLSPDGRYVLYQSDEGGHFTVYVASFPSFAEKIRIPVQSGKDASWTRAGREITYRNDEGYLTSVEISTSPALALGPRKSLFLWTRTGDRVYYAVSPDGERFLIPESAQDKVRERQEVTVVVNWFADMK